MTCSSAAAGVKTVFSVYGFLGLLPWTGDVATPQRSAGQAGRARTLLQAGVPGGAAHLWAILLPTPQQGQGPGQVESKNSQSYVHVLKLWTVMCGESTRWQHSKSARSYFSGEMEGCNFLHTHSSQFPSKKPSLSHHQSCSFSAKLVRNCLQVMESNKCITVTSYSNTLAFGSNRVIQRINLFWYLVLF